MSFKLRARQAHATAAAGRRSSALFSAPGFYRSARIAPRQAFGNQLVKGNRAERGYMPVPSTGYRIPVPAAGPVRANSFEILAAMILGMSLASFAL
jgi:hypothetical protein